ncbi:hypothetical protein BKA61DRAFT_680655 [Leptodontidium sp. MPI-SDFR-AT-0119]|nr:hypothetical protein BKA61DRAFT_680655 [Leptodontidium sp. MPI-SDFR-AT-0119]
MAKRTVDLTWVSENYGEHEPPTFKRTARPRARPKRPPPLYKAGSRNALSVPTTQTRQKQRAKHHFIGFTVDGTVLFPRLQAKLSSVEPATTADARSDIDGGHALSHDGACNLIWSDSERIGDDGGGGDPGPLDKRADESSEDYIEPDSKPLSSEPSFGLYLSPPAPTTQSNIPSPPPKREPTPTRPAETKQKSNKPPELEPEMESQWASQMQLHIHIESSWVGLVTLPAAVIDGDDDICDTATHAVYPVPHHSSPPSISSSSSTSSPLSSLRSSPASSPPPFTISSPRISLRGTSGNGPSYDGMYVGMDGPNKRKRRRTSCGAPHKATESSQLERPLTKAIEAVGTNDAAGEAFDGQVQKSNPELLHTGAEEATVLKGELPAASPPKAENACEGADLKNQVTSLEGGMLEILRREDAVEIMTSLVLTATKARTQAAFDYSPPNRR